MKKRLTFQCWNCSKTYTLLREITSEQKLFVACPYCNAEAVVDLLPFRKISVFKDLGSGEQEIGPELQLPDVLPTKPREETAS
jgi:DNA-directed RNA polymerase subunit RPC12/RpoP